MRLDQLLAKFIQELEQAGIGTARLDSLVLIEDVTGRDRAWLLANPEVEISARNEAELKKLLKLRASHLPLAYVRGKTEFYGCEFLITHDVLEPRPESETMIEELLKLPDLGTQPYIADVGTGSGALGITAKLEIPDARVDLIDVDSKALKTAKMNVDKFTLPIKAFRSDLLAATDTGYDALLCNLPYVPDDFKINTSAAHEPPIAIYGGPDGLDVYRKLFKQVAKRSSKPLYILTEAFPSQQEELAVIANPAGYKEVRGNDFIQLFICTQK
jgi:release factor glutamine methyltransferase